MFHTLWIVMSTLVLVPLGVASLRGWTPRWSPAMSARVTKARGAAAFMIYGASLTPAVLGLAGVPADGLLLLRITAGPLLLLIAVGVVVWASLPGLRRHEGTTRRPAG
ncbi:hypothetical protein I2W78_13125 [Streptomyces spinoverrucosus]|uniref:hypothetical protein n=1 Tax=Streptomyces spinoverrucosus TaxID=284043 RepID=UPI0018C36F25|nr:hypothetical protein [Streptomyces spinoverrucosus]MBG0852756.1 hypothetical protein [Streptomyces spinoverrucosus]